MYKRVLLLALVALSGLLLIGYLFFFDRSEEQLVEVEFTPTSLKLAILNGCGVAGAATEVKEYFINKAAGDIDITAWRNVDRNMFIYKKSIIVNKREESEKLKYLMHLTGITRNISVIDPNSIEDLQIILGNDYREFFKK